MKRILAVAVALAALAAGAAPALAAEKLDYRHHYFWIETPAAPPDRGCDVRTLSFIVNRGDICPAADAPLVPPFIVP